jgi:hypothetical protein
MLTHGCLLVDSSGWKLLEISFLSSRSGVVLNSSSSRKSVRDACWVVIMLMILVSSRENSLKRPGSERWRGSAVRWVFRNFSRDDDLCFDHW